MNREIKFRCWDVDRKAWMNDVDTYAQLADQARFNPENGENYILCQFTGLKDKNEIEVYEGDIICVHEENGEDYVHSVEWGGDYPAFTLKPSTEAEYNDLQHACTVVSCEVIGNIYQSPELTP